ncbi:MAG: hemolysin family protein [Myxococcaceae bacterium]
MSAAAGHIAIAMALIGLNAFFVLAEMALVKVRPARLKALAEAGRRDAASALHIIEDFTPYLSLIQFGVTLCAVGIGWVGEPAVADTLERLLRPFLHDQPTLLAALRTFSVVVGFALVTVLCLVLGELVPKGIAIQQAEGTAMAVAGPLRVLYVLFFPGVWLVNRASGFVLRLLGLRSKPGQEQAHTEDELRIILASAAEMGTIDSTRAELLERALAMTEKTARQILVPRTEVHFLDLEESLEHNVAEARATGHSWVPVCRGNLDQVEGVVNVKDLFVLLAEGKLRSLSQLQRPVLFVPENVTLDQLLAEFAKRHRQLAVVVDEHGGTSGIVSVSDVVSEVVGDVAKLGRHSVEVKTLPGGRFEVSGTTSLEELRERLDMEFDADAADVTTIAGYLMAKLNRVPVPGDAAAVGEWEVRVAETDGPRVVKVRIEPRATALAARPPEAGGPPPGAA